MRDKTNPASVLLVGAALFFLLALSGGAGPTSQPQIGLYVPYRYGAASRLLVNTSNGKLCWPANVAKQAQTLDPIELNAPACGTE
jgi:hypothetical protein